MMSGQAFNALLKTLEEPPGYVIFILATTEYNKLPTTIVSRCQRFDFKRIASDIIVNRLLTMSKKEGIDITEDAARVIARVSRGGMRDAISLLELCAGANMLIDEALVFATVGSGNRESAYKIIEAVGKSDFETVYAVIDDIVMKSGDLSVFWQEIIDSYRDIMVVKNSERAKKYLDLTDMEYSRLQNIAKEYSMTKLSYHVTLLEGAIADMQRAFNSKRSIAEITLTRMCDARLSGLDEALLVRLEELEKTVKMIKLGALPVSKPGEEKEQAVSKDNITQNKNENSKVQVKNNAPYFLYSEWGTVISKISEIKVSLSAGIASASAYTNGSGEFKIKLTDFFAKKLKANETDMAILKGVIAEVEGKDQAEINIVIESNLNKQSDAFSEIENALR